MKVAFHTKFTDVGPNKLSWASICTDLLDFRGFVQAECRKWARVPLDCEARIAYDPLDIEAPGVISFYRDEGGGCYRSVPYDDCAKFQVSVVPWKDPTE